MAGKVSLSVGPQDADFATIAAALKEAPRGATLSIAPGTYTETLNIETDLTLMGSGAVEAVVLSGAVILGGGRVSIAGCSLTGGLVVTSGKPILTECRISAMSLETAAAPRLIECQLSGVSIRDQAAGVFENCEMTGAGIQISGAASPKLKGCRVHDSAGIRISGEATPNLSGCEITHSTGVGLTITGGAPVVRRCNIHHNTANGVSLSSAAAGSLISCEIANNGAPGLVSRALQPRCSRAATFTTTLGRARSSGAARPPWRAVVCTITTSPTWWWSAVHPR
jgi:hypothetical protein